MENQSNRASEVEHPAGNRQASWRDLYPFESHFLDLQSVMSKGGHSPGNQQSAQSNNAAGGCVRLHYVDQGPTDPSAAQNGKPDECCLFVHGNPTWSFYWRNLIQGLSPERRCVAVDHVGCGLSDKPQQFEYTLARHVDHLCQLIDHLDLKNITLVAHDWGGAIGLGAALERSDRIARIVLMNTGAFPPPYIPWQIQLCRIPVVGTLAIRGLNGFAAAALTMATSLPKGLPKLVKQGLIAPYHDWESRIATDAFVKDIPSTAKHPTYQVLERIEQSLGKFSDVPVQLIWGMNDWCFRPECLYRFQRLFPQAQTLEIPEANHYVVEDAPEKVLKQIQSFVNRTVLR